MKTTLLINSIELLHRMYMLEDDSVLQEHFNYYSCRIKLCLHFIVLLYDLVFARGCNLPRGLPCEIPNFKYSVKIVSSALLVFILKYGKKSAFKKCSL